jgi:hypothetical protein
LLIAATLTFIIGLYSAFFTDTGEKTDWIDGASIYFACIFVASFTAAFDYLKEK